MRHGRADAPQHLYRHRRGVRRRLAHREGRDGGTVAAKGTKPCVRTVRVCLCALPVKAGWGSCRIWSTRVADPVETEVASCVYLQPPTPYGDFMHPADFGLTATALTLSGTGVAAGPD